MKKSRFLEWMKFGQKPLQIDDLKSSSTFCIMPWVHFHVSQNGTVTPCCQAPWQEEHSFGHIDNSSIKEIWNNDKIRDFRKNMLKGKKDARCTRCYQKEESNGSV